MDEIPNARAQGVVLDDRYELQELVGTGGMAEVWRATDRRLERDVALKLLSGSAARDESRRRKIEREARALAATNHPNIVSVYDYGEGETTSGDVLPYVVMELIDGPDLHRYLAKRGPLEIEEARTMLIGILNAVDRAHAAGIVHGDLKPANVYIGSHGPKVGDFGVARILDQETGMTTAAATPNFAAPEVLKGERPTPSTDVYSVGCLAFEVLTGNPPFRGANGWEVAQKHLEEPVPRVGKLRSDVPREFDDAIQKAMDKNPRRRFASAAEFADALGDVRAAAPPTATVPVAAGVLAGGPEPTQMLDRTRPVNLQRAALLGAPLAAFWGRAASGAGRFRAMVARSSHGRSLLAGLVALLLLLAFLLMRDTTPDTVAVPDVTGQKVSDAAANLRLKGFKVTGPSYRPILEGEPNRVITTLPAAKEAVEPASEIHLIAGAMARTPAPAPVVERRGDGGGDGDGDGEGRGRGKGKKNDD